MDAFSIVETLARADETMPLAAISESCELPKSSAHRLISTLVELGYAEKVDDSGNYRLGLAAVRLANTARGSSALLRAAKPTMDRLAADIGETILLGVLRDIELIYLYTAEPREAVRLTSYPYPVGSPHASSLGKVLLAMGAEPERVTRVAAALREITPTTISDPEKFTQELASVRHRGYATNDEEQIRGVRAVGVPIRDADGDVVAALSIAGPSQRVDASRLEKLLPAAQKAAEEISLRLGFRVSEPA